MMRDGKGMRYVLDDVKATRRSSARFERRPE
jgi:hypothetical protein